MIILKVDFANVVNFCGAIRSATSNTVVGDRPGQVPTTIELDEKMRFIRLSRLSNGREAVKYVPMSNVTGFEVDESVPAVKPAQAKAGGK